MLHGRGADEADLMGLAGALDPRLTIVSARAPFRLGPGFAWYGMGQVCQPAKDTLHTSLGELREFIGGMVSAYSIDPQKLYAMGFSQGAVMAAGLALTEPGQMRGVVMHSGYTPTDSGLAIQPGGLAGKPFFVAHGVYDEVIPVTFGRKSKDYLLSMGADLTYSEYLIGHTISEESLYDLSEWLTSQLDRAT